LVLLVLRLSKWSRYFFVEGGRLLILTLTLVLVLVLFARGLSSVKKLRWIQLLVHVGVLIEKIIAQWLDHRLTKLIQRRR
jgi:hypothetical protein